MSIRNALIGSAILLNSTIIAVGGICIEHRLTIAEEVINRDHDALVAEIITEAMLEAKVDEQEATIKSLESKVYDLECKQLGKICP